MLTILARFFAYIKKIYTKSLFFLVTLALLFKYEKNFTVAAYTFSSV